MAVNLIDRVRDLQNAMIVGQNEVKIAFWTNTRFLATEGLNGCTGVAIISPNAGILAHIAPVPSIASVSTGSQDPGMQNLIQMMQRVITLYNTYRTHFPRAQSHVVAAIYQGRYALPDAIRTITSVLERLQLSVTITHYNVLQPGTPRAAGQTSIVIVAGAVGDLPRVFVNNAAVDTA